MVCGAFIRTKLGSANKGQMELSDISYWSPSYRNFCRNKEFPYLAMSYLYERYIKLHSTSLHTTQQSYRQIEQKIEKKLQHFIILVWSVLTFSAYDGRHWSKSSLLIAEQPFFFVFNCFFFNLGKAVSLLSVHNTDSKGCVFALLYFTALIKQKFPVICYNRW